jgi:hypothetical protein
MLTPVLRRLLVARLRGPRRQCVHGQPPSSVDRSAAGMVRVLAPAESADLVVEEGLEPSGPYSTKSARTDIQRSSLLIQVEADQKLFQLRRGEDPDRAWYEMLAAMGSPSPANDVGSGASASSGDGLSAFVARVLDQLALSAWLPAAFLTAGVAVLLEFRSRRSASILNAVGKLTAHPVQVLVIIIPLLVIATVVTQAFSYEAIRALEGYWPRRGPVGLLAKLMIRRHVHRKKTIIERRSKESAKAFTAALPKIILESDDLTGPIARAIESQLSGRGPGASGLQGEELQVFINTIQTWRDQAEAWRLARIDRLISEQKSYPVDSRVLPTKLGNLLRTTEDELKHASGDVRSFVLRQRNTVSRRIQVQHDQFRTRLDMYCTLVFVSAFLAVISPIALIGRIGNISTALATVSFAIMAITSYLAAIVSASGYCTALRQMDEVASTIGER